MAASVNKVILIGNLGRDPEVRNMQNGNKVVNMTIATSDTWNDKQSGERKERTEWHRIVIFNERLADFAEKYLRKGRTVYVEGALATRKWTDQSGQEKYTTEIVLNQFRGELQALDSKNAGEAGAGGEAGGYRSAARTNAPARAPAADGPSWDSGKSGGDLDDEIPF